MKVLVVNAFVREDAGDAALLGVLIDQIEAVFPGCEVRIASLEDPQERPTFGHARNVGSARRYSANEEIPRSLRGARKALVAAIGRTWFRGPRAIYPILRRVLPSEVAAELAAIAESDLIVSVGGGYLNGQPGLAGDLAVACTLFPIQVAERLGKAVVFAPQSFGPFGSDRQRKAVREALERASLVLSREETSVALLGAIGLNPGGVRQTVDSAFAFRPSPPGGLRERLSLPPDEVLVGLTARHWLAAEAQGRYERALVETVDHIQRTPGRRVVLIPQVTAPLEGEDDRIVERRIAEQCDPGRLPLTLEERNDHQDLKAVYADLDYLIGTRFHSVIFGLTSNIPSIAIEYHHKTSGIMKDLDLSRWVVKIEKVTGVQLIALFDQLVEQRDGYREHLDRVLPAYRDRANEVAGMIREAYEGHLAATARAPSA